MSDLTALPRLESPAVATAGLPLRVAHVLLDLEMAGAQMVCARLASRLDRGRFAPRVFALQGQGALAAWLEERGVPVECLEAPDGFRPELVFRLAARLRKMQADLVHCHNCKAMLYGGLAAALLPRARVVMTKHGAAHWTTGAVAATGRLLMRRAAAVTTVSEEIAPPLRDGGWVSPERLLTIANGVDTEEFRPAEDPGAERARLGLTRQHRLVGMVQRLSPEKDPANLLRAFVRVAGEAPEARLVVIGEGPLRVELETLAVDSGVRNRVHFLGERPDVAQLLPALDVFCLPSRTEGISLSLLEAMACGLPVVATAVGGTPAVVAEGRSGFLVPPERPDELADSLLKVLKDPAAARMMGDEGRRIACARYSLAASVERYAALYERVSGRRA